MSLTTQINENQCIGDSLDTFNANFSALDTALQSLSGQISTIHIGPSATLTTLVSSLSVFSPAGSYIGFIPIYR